MANSLGATSTTIGQFCLDENAIASPTFKDSKKNFYRQLIHEPNDIRKRKGNRNPYICNARKRRNCSSELEVTPTLNSRDLISFGKSCSKAKLSDLTFRESLS